MHTYEKCVLLGRELVGRSKGSQYVSQLRNTCYRLRLGPSYTCSPRKPHERSTNVGECESVYATRAPIVV